MNQPFPPLHACVAKFRSLYPAQLLPAEGALGLYPGRLQRFNRLLALPISVYNVATICSGPSRIKHQFEPHCMNGPKLFAMNILELGSYARCSISAFEK